MELVWPSREHLASYAQALERGWTPDNVRPNLREEALASIRDQPDAFLAVQVDREGKGPAIILPDGTRANRIPGYHRWMWDGEFCGSIGFRWQPGTTDLPPTCLGHIGYGVVPWKQGRGYATRALALILPEVKREGLSFVEITTDETNLASQRVIEKNGGQFVERFTKLPVYGGTPTLRYRIDLA